MPSLWGGLGELSLETINFIADRVGDLASKLDQQALECLRSIE